jgi:hypothetical protein
MSLFALKPAIHFRVGPIHWMFLNHHPWNTTNLIFLFHPEPSDLVLCQDGPFMAVFP